MSYRWTLVPLLACAAFAQTRWDNELKVEFRGGALLAIHTESSKVNSPLSMSGVVAVSAGDVSHRVVLDPNGSPLFGYDIEARRSGPGMIMVRIRPFDQEKIRTEKWYPKGKAPDGIPTLAQEREFPGLVKGDSVQVDILYHPGTGEKIWDVLRVIDEPAPVVKPKPDEQISLERVRVVLDGKTIAENRNTWIIGPAMLMGVEGRGSYYMLLSPPTEYPFQASGWVDHNVLRFRAGDSSVEITGKTNILQSAEYGTVWIYFVPDPRPTATPGAVVFVSASTMADLLPVKRAPKREE